MLAVPEPPLPGQVERDRRVAGQRRLQHDLVDLQQRHVGIARDRCAARSSAGCWASVRRPGRRRCGCRRRAGTAAAYRRTAPCRAACPLPVPGLSAHVGDRRQIVGEELVQHAVRAEQLRELADLRVARGVARERIFVRRPRAGRTWRCWRAPGSSAPSCCRLPRPRIPRRPPRSCGRTAWAGARRCRAD